MYTKQRIHQCVVCILTFINEDNRKPVNQNSAKSWLRLKEVRTDTNYFGVPQSVASIVVTNWGINEPDNGLKVLQAFVLRLD